MLVLEENIKFVLASENWDISFPISIYEPSEIYSQPLHPLTLCQKLLIESHDQHFKGK